MAPWEFLAMFNLKTYEFWFDLALLGLLWIGVLYLPASTMSIGTLSLSDLLKIITLIGTLEALGYFSQYLFGNRKGLLVQGFLGGLISSTMTFLRLCNVPENSFQPMLITRALLLAVLAMLIECILIIYAIHPSPLEVSKLVILQGGIIAFVIVVISWFSPKNTRVDQIFEEDVKIHDPIVWKKVIYFSFLIVFIIQLLHFTNEQLSIPYIYSVLLISLMEAHGVLAAAITKFSHTSETEEIQKIVAMVLMGNIIGKTYFVFRCKTKKVLWPVLLTLFGSLGLALILNQIRFF